MFRAFLLAAAWLAGFAVSAVAQARAPMSAEAQARWAAVGRLNVAGAGQCTATLIAPDLVLTAAHCLVHRVTGAVFRAEGLHFLAGWRMGDFAAHLRGAAVALGDGAAGIERDLALIRLREPAPGTLAPLPAARRAVRAGERVSVLGYGRDRAEALSMQADCTVTGRAGAVLITDCEAVEGVSGAPVLRVGPEGAEVVGVVSARTGTRASGPGEALAVAVERLLPALRAELEAGR